MPYDEKETKSDKSSVEWLFWIEHRGTYPRHLVSSNCNK